MKFLKKYRIIISLTAVVLLSVAVLFYIRQQLLYSDNPGLIPPRKNYDVALELSQEQKISYETELKKYDDLIKNFIPTTGEQDIDLGNGVKGTTKTKTRPADTWFSEKAKYLEYLGRYTESIRTYNELFSYYERSSLGRINLGDLYVTLKEPKLALLQFKKLLEVSPGFDTYYYKQIVKLYLQLGKPEEAGQRYIQYEKFGGTKDTKLMNQIKEMKRKN